MPAEKKSTFQRRTPHWVYQNNVFNFFMLVCGLIQSSLEAEMIDSEKLKY